MTPYLSKTVNKAFETYWEALAQVRRLQVQNAPWEVLSSAASVADWHSLELLESITAEAEQIQDLEKLFKK